MARFLGLLSFVATMVSVGAAWAVPHEHVPHSVPELSATGAAGGIALVIGATALVLSRRRRKP
jgi:uncharacterized protein (TIGR03382 family)